MISSARIRTVLRLSPVALAAGAITMAGVTLAGGSAQASPVLAANLRLMDHMQMAAGDGPALHSMVAPAPPGVDVTVPTSDTTLAKRSGLSLDPFAEPVSAADNPTLVTSAATAPAGVPHMSNLLNKHVAPSCLGTGTDGKRVQVVYAYETGSTNDYANKEAILRNEIANIDDVFALSSAETGGGKRVRWVTDGNCVPQITVVQVPAGQVSNSANGAGYWSTFKSTLASQGLNRADRKYLVFGDAPAANPGICGLGDRYADERPTPGQNYNDYYAAQYGAVYQACFAGFSNAQTSAGHELVHTLGAVQGGSPNASQFGHCTDDGDLMCYPDGSSTPIRQVCPTSHEPLLDCNHDDYFSTSPAAGTYLANSWNVANSSYLDTVSTLDPLPTVSLTGPTSGTTGQALTFTATTAGTPTGYEWSVNNVTVTGATASTFTYTPRSWETGNRTVAVRAIMPDGRKSTATTTVNVAAAPKPVATLTIPASVKPGETFTVTANATGTGALAYTWTTGGRCLPTGSTTGPSVTLNCTGFTASTEPIGVTVTQADGQATTASGTINVTSNAMQARITGPSTVQVGTTGKYTVEVLNVPAGWTVSWSDGQGWISGGNASYDSPVTQITPTAVGTDVLTALVASSANGMNQYQYVDFTITSVPAPVATITGPTSTPVGFGATYTAKLTPATDATYAWTSATGWISGPTTGQSVTVNPTGTGSATVKVTATLASGATVTKSMTVTATPALTGDLTGPTTVEAGQSGPFAFTANRAVTVAWATDRNDCALSATTGPTTGVTCPADATGTVSLTATATDTVTKQVLTRTSTHTLVPPRAQTVLTVTKAGTNPATLTGTLRNMTSATAVAGAAVKVERKWYGTTAYSAVATLTTNTAGQVAYRASADRAAYYRFVYAGSDTLRPMASTETIVAMATKTALSVKTGYPTTFSGSVLNAVTSKAVPTGTPVALKVKWYGTSTWSTAANLKTDAYGKVTWKWYATRNGYFQLVYAGNTSTVSSASTAPLVRIPTKVSMTVKTGRPDTIGGRLTTGAGTALKYTYVTLQYRTYGTSTWRTVTTKVRTSSTGYLTYKVQPKKRTYYRWLYSGTSTGYLGSTSASGYVSY